MRTQQCPDVPSRHQTTERTDSLSQGEADTAYPLDAWGRAGSLGQSKSERERLLTI